MQNINNSKQIQPRPIIRAAADQLQTCTTQLKIYLYCKSWGNKKYFRHLQYTVLAITTMFIMNAVTAQTINGAFKTPVTMPATRSFYLGLFMTFGIDRRDDFINDNL